MLNMHAYAGEIEWYTFVEFLISTKLSFAHRISLICKLSFPFPIDFSMLSQAIFQLHEVRCRLFRIEINVLNENLILMLFLNVSNPLYVATGKKKKIEKANPWAAWIRPNA